MSWRQVIKPAAEKQLGALPRDMQFRLVMKLAGIETNPRGPGSVKLQGTKATYRVRSGDYRIVYEVDDAAKIVYVTIVAHRREVYRGL